MSEYPENWKTLSADERHAFFADEARKYRAAHPNGNGADVKAIPESAASSIDGDTPADDREIKRLATLRLIDFEKERKAAAERLGVRASVLDKVVAAARPDEKTGHGRGVELKDPEPWPELVNGSALLDDIAALLKRFVVCDEYSCAAVTLWIACTWFEEAAQIAPILNLQSPEKRCGKSTLLSIIIRLVKRALPSSNISAAMIYRVIEQCTPTLVIDEADAFLNENEEARGILNSGHTRDLAFVIRGEGDDHTPKQFSTWGFKALSGIGKRAATIEDRSIIVALKRKAKGEKVARLRHAPKAAFDEIVSKLAKFSIDNMGAFSRARPDLPEALNDRAQDNWEPLLAIADIAGRSWSEKAKTAALLLNGEEHEEQSLSTMLLADIKTVLDEKTGDYITSIDLVYALVAMTDRPWGEINHGKAMTQNGLARRVKGFGIKPGKVGPKRDRLNGYEREAFADTLSRYIPGVPTGHPYTQNEINVLDNKLSGHLKNQCPVENDSKSLKINDVSGCQVQNGESGEDNEIIIDEGLI
jgi:putative DNA primase/helicase